ncbi:hypothetical protein D9758_013618 [Tetrapyrgos nigripes]|uniref:Cytochrome P450 n=1 Tax=Tetrapyrgos nigripes TaxID=182062 RepID=A0A8H5FQI8_9AGAR|nr:hypothetical protein D9758_013618 [Tetrapyrgos nigripes]
MFCFNLDPQTTYALIIAIPVVWAFRIYTEYKALTQQDGIRQILGPVTLFAAYSMPAFTFHNSSRIALGYFQFWLSRRDWYENAKSDIVYAVSLLPRVKLTLLVADPSVAKQITSSRIHFPKPVEKYGLLTVFGSNIVASEGNLWKKYRRICAPSFSERNNRLVWDTTMRAINGFFESEDWKQSLRNSGKVVIQDLRVHTADWTLRVIAAAGFGQDLSTQTFSQADGNSSLPTAKDAFEIVSKDIMLYLLLPKWFLNHSDQFTWGRVKTKLSGVRRAFTNLQDYLLGIINERRSDGDSTVEGPDSEMSTNHDLFTNLLRANDAEHEETEADDDSKPTLRLDDSELIGNIFVFLLAGHETTAHTLCFALHLLALYPEEQRKLYDDIRVVCNGRIPDDGCSPGILEALSTRTNVPKTSHDNTSIVVHGPKGVQDLVVPVPQGTQVMLHIAGLHYNPKYWPNPTEFKPDRFMPGPGGDPTWPKDAFIPFSAGSRSCIGRRFAETESVAIITTIVLMYEITVKEDAQFRGETFEEKRRRVLKVLNGPTIKPGAVPLVFRKRD